MLRSAFVLGLAALLLTAAPRVRGGVRPVVVALALVVLLGTAILWPLPVQTHDWMGDIGSYAGHRDRFDYYTEDQVWFSSHLAFFVLDGIDALRGEPEDPAPAFDVLSSFAGMWSAACLFGLAWYERWSTPVIRYVALAIGASQVISYFGYRELGYLALNPAAYPLLDRAVREADRYALVASAVLFGLGAAFHGFGLIGLGGGAAVLVVSRPGASRVMFFVAVGVSMWLGWLLLYGPVLGRPIDAGHAASLPLRGFFTEGVKFTRVVEPLFSLAAARDVVAAMLVVGAPVLLVSFLLPAGAERRQGVPAAALLGGTDLRRLWAFAGCSIVAMAFFWPVQGLAYELDLVMAAFPATYAGLWVAARSGRLAACAWAILAIAHLAFWRVAGADDFIKPFIRS